MSLGCSGSDDPDGASGASGGTPGTAGAGASPGSSTAGSGASTGGSSTGGAGSGGGSTGGSSAGGASVGGSSAAGSAGAGALGGSDGTAGADSTGGTSGETGSGGTGGAAAAPDSGVPIGFASQNGGTTGGKDGEVVTASTFAALKSYAESSEAYVILVEGTISNGADGGQIRVKSNKSIIGVGGNAFLNGIGIDISNNNVILQNLRISLTGVTTRTDKAGVFGDGKVLVNGGDAISISGTSKNIWIDHCEVFSEDPATQTNKDLYDGLIDIKGQTGFITLSWNYLHDHHKGGLVGAADDDLYDDRKVTLHHNYYDNVKLRVPMYRGSTGHFFNNYIAGATDATEIRANTCVRVEKNYYEELHYSIYTPSDSPGKTERIDNIEVKRTERAYPANCTASIPYSYAEVLIDAASVKTAVPAGAGVGKI